MKNSNKLSLLLNNTGSSQIAYFAIREINKLAETEPSVDATIFYENIQRNCLPPNFAIMQIAEAWNQDGSIIATSLSTAHKMIGFMSRKKFFYVWDLEWIRNGGKSQYEHYFQVYTDRSIELIARSESHKECIENAFNREIKHVVSDFDMKEMMEAIK